LIVLPDQNSAIPHLLVGGSKAGKIYVMNRDALGHFNSAGDAQVVQEFPFAPLFSTPAYWNQNLYMAGIKDVVRQFAINNSQLSSAAQGAAVFGYSGTSPVISANGTSEAILWALDNGPAAPATSCSALPGGGPAVLRAYDAANVAHEIYNSSQAGGRDAAGPALRFALPTVANGHLYVPTQTNITVYGLLP